MQLARPAREICLWDILSAIEPVAEFDSCFLGLGRCSDLRPCPLHEAWGPIRSRVLEMLQTRSLWDFASEAERKGLLASSHEPGGSTAGNGRILRAKERIK